MRRAAMIGVLAAAAVCGSGCSPRCPLYDPEGRLVEKNLLIHINEKYKRAAMALSDNQSRTAYMRLSEMAVLVKMVPVDTEPRRNVVEDALKGIERARAALRLSDIFACRKVVRELSGPVKLLNVLLVYQGPPPAGQPPSPAPAAPASGPQPSP